MKDLQVNSAIAAKTTNIHSDSISCTERIDRNGGHGLYRSNFFYLPVADMGGLLVHSHCTRVNISLIITQITLTMCSHTGVGVKHMFLQSNQLWPSCETSSSSPPPVHKQSLCIEWRL